MKEDAIMVKLSLGYNVLYKKKRHWEEFLVYQNNEFRNDDTN